MSPPDEAAAAPRNDQVTEGNGAPPPPGRRELAGRRPTTTPTPDAYARFLSVDDYERQRSTMPDAAVPDAVSIDVRTSLPPIGSTG